MKVMPEVILDWSGVLTTSNKELTDQEISDRYGSLMQTAVSAFLEDPTYVVQMAEAAASMKARRKAREQSPDSKVF